MNLKITCDSFNPYFADICNDLHNYDFNICYRFVDNYYPQKNNSLYNSFKNKNFKKYTNLIFSKLKNCTLDVQADKNILILNDDLDYDYSVYKDVSQRLDMIFVHNNHFKKMINKLMIDHNKNRILNYYAISRNFNLPTKFTYNIDTNVEGKKYYRQ